jgi:hypothetical protein
MYCKTVIDSPGYVWMPTKNKYEKLNAPRSHNDYAKVGPETTTYHENIECAVYLPVVHDGENVFDLSTMTNEQPEFLDGKDYEFSDEIYYIYCTYLPLTISQLI